MLHGKHWVAITGKPMAATAGASLFIQGGNAVDAAVAVGFSMAVTFIDAGNIGGGGFMMIYMDGEPAFLDYRETAPLAAHRDMFLDEHGDDIDLRAQEANAHGRLGDLHSRLGDTDAAAADLDDARRRRVAHGQRYSDRAAGR